MPILKNAKKALRSSKRKTTINSRIKSRLRTMVEKMVKNPSADQLKLVFSAVDKAKKRNIIHPNKAARIKSKMNKLAAAK